MIRISGEVLGQGGDKGGGGGILKGQLPLSFAERATRALMKILISVMFTNIS